MAIAVLAPVIAPYRVPLYERLAREHGAEVLTYGGGERYVPPWFETPAASAAFPTRALADGWREALALAGRYDAVIAPYGGGAILPAAYLGCRARRRPFLLWASVWAQPLSVTNLIALPVTRDMYRHGAADGTTTCSWRRSRSRPICSAGSSRRRRRTSSAPATASLPARSPSMSGGSSPRRGSPSSSARGSRRDQRRRWS